MGQEVICIGDSITGWNYLSKDKTTWPFATYPELLEKKLLEKGYDFKVINRGYDGEPAVNGPSRIDEALASHSNAKYFVVLFGTNDIYHNPFRVQETIDRVIVNLGFCVDRIKRKGRVPILLTIPKILDDSNTAEYNHSVALCNERLILYCKKQKISVADISSKLSKNHFGDAVHPNLKGAQIIAKEVYTKIRSVLY